MELDERKSRILKAIVESYIASGEPIGSKALADSLGFTRQQVRTALEKLKSTAQRLCVMLDLKDGNARQYVGAAASILSMWAGENVTDCNIGNIFL